MAVDRYSANSTGETGPSAIESGAATIMLPSAEILVNGEYQQSGNDLLITGPDGSHFVVIGYFTFADLPTLQAPNGAFLEGDLVTKLAGPRVIAAYAQTGEVAGAQPIGEIVVAEGAASVQRGGTGETLTLSVGDPVFTNDVIDTADGAKIGISFIDETVLTINAGSRMVLDELVYNPGGDDSSMLLSLVNGSFAFISGEIAPSGNMVMRTPVATLGIRGTSGTGAYDPADNIAQFADFPDLDGIVYPIDVFDADGNYLGTLSTSGIIAFFDGSNFFQGLPDAGQQEVFDDIRQFLIEAAASAGLDVTNATDEDGNQRFSLIIDSAFDDGASSANGGSGGPLIGAGAGAAGSGVADDDPDVNNPPLGSPLLAATNEDAPLFSANLLTGWFDPEGHFLVVEAVTATASDGRVVVFTLTTDPAGSIATFALDPDQFDDLALGESVTVTVDYRVSDGTFIGPGVAPDGSLTLLISGRNDTPVVTIQAAPVPLSEAVDTTGQASPPIATSAVQTITFQDDDLSNVINNGSVNSVAIASSTSTAGLATALASASGTTLEAKLLSSGFLTIDAVSKLAGDLSGTLEWSFSAPDNVFDYLAVGETTTMTFTLRLDDDEGVIITNPAEGGVSETVILLDVEVTITGTNDRPVIETADQDVVATTIAERDDGAPAENGAPDHKVEGEIDFTDVDLSDSPTASVNKTTSGADAAVITYTPNAAGATLSVTQIASLLGAFSITPTSFVSATDSDGKVEWTYEIGDSVLDFLGDGETVQVVYTVVIDDGSGTANATAKTTVTINITGTNDAPVIQLADQDVVATTIAERGDDDEAENDEPHHKVEGEIDFTDVDLTDSPSASVNTTKIGPDDATITYTPTAGSGATLTGAQEAVLLGAFSITPTSFVSASDSDGKVEWTYQIADLALDFLAAGETVQIVYKVVIDDGSGTGNATAMTTVTINIEGTNDVAVIDAITQKDLDETTNTDAIAGDISVTFTDVDLTDIGHSATVISTSTAGETAGLALDAAGLAALVTPGAVTKDSGSDAGSVTLSFSAASTVFDYLAKDEVVTLNYNLEIDDGDGGKADKAFEVTITGTNDDPVVDATDVTGAVTEDGPLTSGDLTDTGTIGFTDVDLTDGHSIDATIDESPGALGALTASVTTQTDGAGLGGVITWNYSVANSAVQYLAEGQEKVETFTITLDDDNGGTIERIIEVTITGNNDQPSIAVVDVTGGVTEDAAALILTDSGSVTFSEIDDTDVLTSSVSLPVTSTDGPTGVDDPPVPAIPSGLATALAGAMSLIQTGTNDGTIAWNFALDNSLVQYLGDGQTVTAVYTITVDDQSGEANATQTQDVTVVITGVDETVTVNLGDSPTLDSSGGNVARLTVFAGDGPSDTGNQSVVAAPLTLDADPEPAPAGFGITLTDGSDVATITEADLFSIDELVIDLGEGADSFSLTSDTAKDEFNYGGFIGLDGITVLGGAGVDNIDTSDLINPDNDLFILDGGADNDTIAGSDAADTIIGGLGADTINGNGGNDTLTGGVAGSTPTTSDGAVDTFVFANGDGDNQILDFENNIDEIVLDGFVGGTSTVSATQIGSDTVIAVDFDGAGGPDSPISIELSGVTGLSTVDKVFDDLGTPITVGVGP